MIFYTGWLTLAALFVLNVAGQIPKAIGDWVMLPDIGMAVFALWIGESGLQPGFSSNCRGRKKNRQTPIPEQDECSVSSEEDVPEVSVQQKAPQSSTVRYRPWRFSVPLCHPAPEASIKTTSTRLTFT